MMKICYYMNSLSKQTLLKIFTGYSSDTLVCDMEKVVFFCEMDIELGLIG